MVDRTGPAAGASFGNAGLISLAHPPLPREGLVEDLMRSVEARGVPARLSAPLDPAMRRWLEDLGRAGAKQALARTMAAIDVLSRLTVPLFPTYSDELGIEFELRDGGYMDVYRDEGLFRRARAIAEEVEQLGYTEQALTEEEARSFEPALRRGVVGAIRHAESSVANPTAFVRGLAGALSARGVRILSGVAVRGFEVRGGRVVGVRTAAGDVIDADVTVLAAGIWSSSLAAGLGLAIPMLSGKGYHIMVDHPGEQVRTSVHLGGSWLACTSMDGGLRIAGLLDLGESADAPDQARIDGILPAATRFIEGLEHATLRSSWCGHRPCTADGLPLMGEHPELPGLFISTGHAMMGFWTAPISGVLAAQVITGEPPSCPMDPFRPERFGGVNSRR